MQPLVSMQLFVIEATIGEHAAADGADEAFGADAAIQIRAAVQLF